MGSDVQLEIEYRCWGLDNGDDRVKRLDSVRLTLYELNVCLY